jgi:hypothetical protein
MSSSKPSRLFSAIERANCRIHAETEPRGAVPRPVLQDKSSSESTNREGDQAQGARQRNAEEGRSMFQPIAPLFWLNLSEGHLKVSRIFGCHDPSRIATASWAGVYSPILRHDHPLD